jgi:hypothetical protein
MQNRVNSKFDQIVNKALILSKFQGEATARKMMESAGLSKDIIQRVLNQHIIRSSDWS